MVGWNKKGTRRRILAKSGALPLWKRAASWPTLIGTAFVLGAAAITLVGEAKIDYVIGQRIDQPIYAKVDFQVPDPGRTASDRTAARAKTPSYYKLNSPALTYQRIRADLMRVYQAAVDAGSFEKFQELTREMGLTLDETIYNRLRVMVDMPEDAGRVRFQGWIDGLPLENQYVAQSLSNEPRDPPSLTDYLLLEAQETDGEAVLEEVPRSEIVSQTNEMVLQGIASYIARRLPAFELRPLVDSVVLAVFREQPTVVFDQARTLAEMQAAADAVPPAMKVFERNKPFVNPGILGTEDYKLLQAHHDAYLNYLDEDSDHAIDLRRELLLHRAGLVLLVTFLAVGMVAYIGLYKSSLFAQRDRALSFFILALVTLLAARLLDMRWPQYPQLLFVPMLMTASILAVVFSNRFAMGASCILCVLVTLVARAYMPMLLALLAGAVLAVYQLQEIRTRTKLPTAGALTAMAVMLAVVAGGFLQEQQVSFVLQNAMMSGVVTFAAAGAIALLLPFVERIFGTATSLTLLEWRDPTKPLLQVLAREAPGTYSHSLVLGTLAEAACDKIGADGLLTQVGALYHDIGKIHRPGYFTENQEGRISRHENLAPTMSLLIILGHVKDGLELAKQYKLPRILHQFIAEHHGTTIVKYFHRMATEKQPHISSGRHDRQVAEADFRYSGPKPRIKESAILMLCDGVEGAVRSLGEPTVGRIESTVQQIVTDRLNDGQFDECDITLREIRLVEESLVKSLCSIYHGRVAYPKAIKSQEPRVRHRISV